MIKNRLFTLIVPLIILSLYSCKEQKSAKKKMNEKATICYTAADHLDTAWLRIGTTDKKYILGELLFVYGNKNQYEGLIKAEMKGDTLKGNYSFKLNNVDKWYKNPIALLRNKQTLTMGIGEIYTLWGSGFFLKTVPIDYGKGRFVFKQTGCEIK
jgi:hypothetical protein